MAQEAVFMPAGHTLTLRYRVATFDGEVPVALVNRLSAEWRR